MYTTTYGICILQLKTEKLKRDQATETWVGSARRNPQTRTNHAVG